MAAPIEFSVQGPGDEPLQRARVGGRVHTMTHQKQKGFTLVEIAVVLVIIGLLLGAILQGQQLIASARVSNLSDQQAGIQAAYFGFIDRYRAVPGDMDRAAAEDAIGETIVLGGDGLGRLPPPSSDVSADGEDDNWAALNGVWEHLSKSGFIRGSYEGPDNAQPSASSHAPTNAFNGYVLLSRQNGYEQDGTPPDRLLYNFGQNVPASIARELDVKMDDGRPDTGSVRNATDSGDTTDIWVSGGNCIDTNDEGDSIWDIQTDAQNCNPVFIY